MNTSSYNHWFIKERNFAKTDHTFFKIGQLMWFSQTFYYNGRPEHKVYSKNTKCKEKTNKLRIRMCWSVISFIKFESMNKTVHIHSMLLHKHTERGNDQRGKKRAFNRCEHKHVFIAIGWWMNCVIESVYIRASKMSKEITL